MIVFRDIIQVLTAPVPKLSNMKEMSH